MPRTADPHSRERILDAAARLFYIRGVRAVALSELMNEAGCGKNLIYRHFGGRSGLVTAYLAHIRMQRDRSAAVARARIAAGSSAHRVPGMDASAAVALFALVAEVAEWVQRPDYRGCAFRNYLTEFPAVHDEPAQAAREYLYDTRAEVYALVARLGAGAALADRLWLLIDGLYGTTSAHAEVAVEWAADILGVVPPPGGPDRSVPDELAAG